jgi:hypothetical protein
MSEGWKIQGAEGATLFECDGLMEMSRKLSELKYEIREKKTTEELLVLFKEAVQDKYTWSLEKEVESKPAKKTKGKKRPSTENKPAGERLRLFPSCSFSLVSRLCSFPLCLPNVVLSLPPLSLSRSLANSPSPSCLPACVHSFFILTASCLLFASFAFIQNSF